MKSVKPSQPKPQPQATNRPGSSCGCSAPDGLLIMINGVPVVIKMSGE